MADKICDGTRLPTNLFGHTEYDSDCTFFGGKPPLPEGVGWAVVIGAGLAFVVITGIIVWADVKFGGTAQTSEEFNTAGRSIKTGLTASVIVSQWTWAATLLQSSAVAWKFGVSGPFWYAAGATIQVLLFGILGLHIKLKAPKAHTMLEIVKARWGPTCHLVFLFFCLCTNIVVSAMLILGGAAVTNALTGINIYAAAFLIPVGVVAYTAGGGLKATFLSAYLHTIVLYLALCIFAFGVYANDKDLGSPSKVYDNLQKVSEIYPIKDNKDGSLLTMLSKSGFIFGVINIVGNFGTVFVDQSYWQSAIAAKPSATYKGYILGGLCWFCIPFTLATSLGLAGRALDLPVDIDEVNSGLVPAAVATHMLGKGGAVLLLIMLFMAVTSTGAAEQIAVASLVSYDIYKEYINPKATGKQVVFVSRCMVCAYGVFMGILAVVLFKIGISLGWVYLFMGIVIGSAVFPVYACLTWSKCSANGAIAGAGAGMIAAFIAWLVTCKAYYGEINIDNLGGDYPMLAGNVTALGFSLIVTTIVSLMNPQNYDWESMKNIQMLEEDGTDKLADDGEDSREGLLTALQWTLRWGVTLSLVLVVLWPLLALPAGVFNKAYFTFWVSISLAWGLLATIVITILPLWESRDGLLRVLRNMATGTIPNQEETYGDKASYTGDASVKKIEPAAPAPNAQA